MTDKEIDVLRFTSPDERVIFPDPKIVEEATADYVRKGPDNFGYIIRSRSNVVGLFVVIDNAKLDKRYTMFVRESRGGDALNRMLDKRIYGVRQNSTEEDDTIRNVIAVFGRDNIELTEEFKRDFKLDQ